VPRFWSDQYDLTVRIAGLPDPAASEIVRRRADGVDIHFEMAASGRLLAASAVGVGNAAARDMRLAELLIAERVELQPAELADARLSLKSLLGSSVLG
jgi:3-phenylpropionate/trans-cinnamate dioxygenase ferredoxin reductase subunit